MKEKKQKNEAGITLIALVITIIVLLILAGIAVSMLAGDNGILQQATKAKENTETQSTLEQIQLVAMEAMTNTEHAIQSTNDLETAIARYGIGATVKADSDESPTSWTVTVGEKSYTVAKDGTVTDNSSSGGITAATVKENATEYYGAELTGYTCLNTTGVSKWRIFHSDGTNIYIIADDYINYDNAPTSANYTLYKYSDYRLSFNKVYQDYTGSAWITENSLAKNWLNKYLTNNSTSTNTNIRAVAFMMDTSIWGSLYKGELADYAIGGPTLEMFCESYKATHSSKYIECEAESSSSGYEVGWNNGESDVSYSTRISGLTQDEFNGIYIKSDTTKARAMWIASPSGYDEKHFVPVIFASYDGWIEFDNYYFNYPGLRPLICLKSDVKITKSEEGVYKID